MSITLGAITLPQGLRWSDEHAWSSIQQSITPSLTGALLIQEGQKRAGRPITLLGGNQWAWVTRAELHAIQALLDVPEVELTLTLHDGRAFQVAPVHGSNGPVSAHALPLTHDSGPADPTAGTLYVLDEIRLMVALVAEEP